MTTNASAALYAMAIRLGLPISPDPEVESFMAGEELISDAGGFVALTDRGNVWVDMLLETPIPVQTARWGDPRRFPVLGERIEVMRGERLAVPSGNGGFVAVPTANYSEQFEVPAGFNPNRYVELKPPAVPPGLKPDNDLEVVWRNGQRRKVAAQAVIWSHRNKPDDVMAFRVIPGDTIDAVGKVIA